MRITPLLALCGLLLTSAAHAGPRVLLGESVTHTNDIIGDGMDRWRSATEDFSYLYGPRGMVELPPRFGAFIEWRARMEMITPEWVALPFPPNDRPYVGVLGFGVASHMRRGNSEQSLGFDLVMTGPSTGVSVVQEWVHTNMNHINPQIFADQLPDALYPTASYEYAKVWSKGGAAVRPFADVQIGVETFIRAGVDLTFARAPDLGIRLRNNLTGQRVPALNPSGQRQLSVGLGADVAYMLNSAYLPAARGVTPSPFRTRLRAGVFYQSRKFDLFYGLSWHSPEFTSQREGQVIGTVSLGVRF
jgi:hypothetical protein